MQTVNIELFGPLNVYFATGLQIFTALILGGLVGYDREQKMKAAGLKTNILICLGATLYTSVSLLNFVAYDAPADPNRTAAQVVSGIGFLGAGAILQSRGNIIGLTTAATMWVVAAVGVTIGMGHPIKATLFTLTLLIVLKLLRPFTLLFERPKDFCFFQIEILSRGNVRQTVKRILINAQVDIDHLSEEVVDVEKNTRLIKVMSNMHPRHVQQIVGEIKDLIQVEKVKAHQLADELNEA